MNMIHISIHLDYFDLGRLFAYSRQQLLDVIAKTASQHLSAVFGRYYQMVTCIIYAMPLLAILHTSILAEDSGYFHLRVKTRRITKED